jgi:hypothetical protein
VSSQSKVLLKAVAIAALLTAGGALLFRQLREVSRTGEHGARVWFYDLSEKRLYPVARETIPPHQGIGGVKGDGVRAVVVAPKGKGDSVTARRIAYLESYTSELKKLLDDVTAARAAHRVYPGRLPSRDSDFFGANTMVRRVGDTTWHAASSEEGRRIKTEWRAWRVSEGQPLVFCMPQ